jgi:hypothetical protein
MASLEATLPSLEAHISANAGACAQLQVGEDLRPITHIPGAVATPLHVDLPLADSSDLFWQSSFFLAAVLQGCPLRARIGG